MSEKPGVTVYDTTLRDGTQGTGISLSVQDKLRIAERLDEFGLDYIEGGWPGSNPKDVEFFAGAAGRTWRRAKIVAFGMTRRGGAKVEDDAQVRQLLDARTPVVTVVGKTWPLHVKEVFRVSLGENLAMIRDTVAFLKQHGREVFYDAEHFFDSFREDPDYSLATVKEACDAGADLVVLCDTNGGSLPGYVGEVTRKTAEFLGRPVGTHTHNDCGLGVANALAAVAAGAVQVQGTMNGYGERVGNCNLTTLVPLLQLKLGLPLVPELERLTELSRFIDEVANVPSDIRAPFVGRAAFTHKGGLHVHAVQKLARTYEHIDPALVGNERVVSISDLSGQSNVLMKAEALGLHVAKGSPEVARVLQEVKRLEHEGYEFEAAEASFELLFRRLLGQHKPLFELEEYRCDFVRSGIPGEEWNKCVAAVKLRIDGHSVHQQGGGDGPVNALDAALRAALVPSYPQVSSVRLEDYKVRIINGRLGTAARTRVLVSSTDGHAPWDTVGVSDNIIEASWQALVDSYDYAVLRSGRET
ncbi:MAG: citramalate synthase [Chthoniobacterales bacterium]|nr:citramalate synthase [Chthoniobacterales bacterium]